MNAPREKRNGQREHPSRAEPAAYFSNPMMSDIESDWSPMHDAAYNGRVLSVRTLIGQGTSVNLLSLDRVSPLHGACQQGHTACVKLLIDHGANVNTPTIDMITPLSEACARGHLSCVKLLLQQGATPHGAAVSTSPIHQAAAKGASVNSGKDGDTPLHVAARLSQPELVRVLLDHGANPATRNTEGKRPLDLAPPNSATQSLLSQRGGVSCLMQLCRLTIRAVLGKTGLSEINGLSIPTELKGYLLYQSD
ncbi:ankyrin repeat and SOCS box protein 9-like isoform X2 [Megalops cyprinoides]|uniref:ankyrin repeat and SOCS box protein 9-like isoform X2 n=1 Tax=Megalops cyprinoides TaxID=118141 RepID=UPI00186559E6|nr:ankyrin repeat and SOCS box protein 9-like isoform X2 [Megalops cyprinoides]